MLYRKTIVHSDHANIRYFLNYTSQKDNSKFQRWTALLSEYDFTFEWVPGSQQYAADALSRQPLPTTEGAPEAETAKVTDVPQACQDFLDKYPDPSGKVAAVSPGLIVPTRLPPGVRRDHC